MNPRLLHLPIDISLKINRDFTSVYDLSWTLVDLQALLSGFLYSLDVSYDEFYKQTPYLEEEVIHPLTDEIIKRIDNIVPLDREKQKKITEEIDEVLEPNKVALKKEPSIRKYHSASRHVTGKYKEILKLRSFEKGSLILDVTSNVLGGLLLEFLKKLLFEEQKQTPPVVINYIDQKILIINNNEIHKINELSRYQVAENKDTTRILSTNSYIEETIDRVQVTDSITGSVTSLLDVLISEGLIPSHISYNERAIKTIVSDITRVKGSLFDIKA